MDPYHYTDMPGSPFGGPVTPEHPFKVEVKPFGEAGYAPNGLSFVTVEDAETYARDLMSRWFGAETYRVVDTRTGEVVAS